MERKLTSKIKKINKVHFSIFHTGFWAGRECTEMGAHEKGQLDMYHTQMKYYFNE